MMTKKVLALIAAVFTVFSLITSSAMAKDKTITGGESFETASEIATGDYVNDLGDGSDRFFKFTAVDDPAYYTVFVENMNAKEIHWYLYNQYMTEIFSNYYYEGLLGEYIPKVSASYKPAPGTVCYIRISGERSSEFDLGNYRIKLTYSIDDVTDSLDEGNPTALETDKWISYQMDGINDTDVFSFVLPGTCTEKPTVSVRNVNCADPIEYTFRDEKQSDLHLGYSFVEDYDVWSSGRRNIDISSLETGKKYYIDITYDPLGKYVRDDFQPGEYMIYINTKTNEPAPDPEGTSTEPTVTQDPINTAEPTAAQAPADTAKPAVTPKPTGQETSKPIVKDNSNPENVLPAKTGDNSIISFVAAFAAIMTAVVLITVISIRSGKEDI